MNHMVDARGKQCPIPVVETKKVLAQMNQEDQVTVWVDNEIAVQNLSKMAGQKNLQCESKQLADNHYEVVLAFSPAALNQKAEQAPVAAPKVAVPDKTVVVISSNTMGNGDDVLGVSLMKSFLYALTEQDVLPAMILLYNGGAKLSAQQSPALEDLKLLQEQGVEILTCGACLNHYGLTEQLAVGSVTNMYSIVEHMMQATKIIRP